MRLVCKVLSFLASSEAQPIEQAKQKQEDLREEARNLMKNVLSKNTANHPNRNVSLLPPRNRLHANPNLCGGAALGDR